MVKNKHEPISPDELVQLVLEEFSDADYSGTNELSFQREEATRAYNGELTDGLQPTTGMSSIINNKVQPSIEALTDHVARPFISDQDTVMFTPTLQELFPAAEQMTEIVNYVIHRQNNGSTLISEWLKDAAINKNGIVKVTWQDAPLVYKESFEGSQNDIDIWTSEKEATGVEVDIIEEEKETVVNEMTVEGSDEYLEVSTTTTKVTAKITRPGGRVVIENVPPEEFLINEGATSINNDVKTRFVAQRQQIPVGELMREYPDSDIDFMALSANNTLDTDYERQNRHTIDGTYESFGQEGGHGANRLVEVIEAWVNADVDGDGFAERRHVMVAGNELLLDEEWFGEIPFASYTLFPIPHKFYGLSVYDKIQQYHRAASMMLRSEIDFRLQQNTFRLIANPKELDLRDLMSGRPGIIKAKPGFDPKNVMPIQPAGGAGNTPAILQYLHQEIAGQIGIDPNTGVVNADISKSGNDSDKTAQVVDAASNRVEGYARRFADGGLKDVIWQITKLILANSDDPGVKRVVDKITPGIPLLLAEEGMVEAIDRDDLSAKVGLGFQTMQQKLIGAEKILQQQMALEQSPTNPTPLPAKFKLAAAEELAKAMGYEDTSKFFPSPEAVEAERQRMQQQQAQASAAQMQMAKAEQEDNFANSEFKRRLDEAQAKKAEIEAAAAERQQQLIEEKAVVDIQNVQDDNSLNIRRQEAQEEQMAANLELQKANEMLQRELAELKSLTSIEVAEIQADSRPTNKDNG